MRNSYLNLVTVFVKSFFINVWRETPTDKSNYGSNAFDWTTHSLHHRLGYIMHSTCTEKSGFPSSCSELFAGMTPEVGFPTWEVGGTSPAPSSKPTWLCSSALSESCNSCKKNIYIYIYVCHLIKCTHSSIQHQMQNLCTCCYDANTG